MSDKPSFGVAIFGLGRAGSIHYGNLLANNRAHILYVVDLDTAKCEDVIGGGSLSKSIKILHPDHEQEVYSDERVAGVIVCSPTYTHEHIVKEALRHNKHVFCEKPISENMDGITECYKEASLANKSLMCSLNRRFDPSVRHVKDQAALGNLGNILSVKTCSRDHPVPSIEYLKISGGIFHDCAIHDIDMVCWILQEYLVSVFAYGNAVNKEIAAIGDVDTVAIVCKFASGVLAMIELSRLANYGYDQRLEVHGTKGMLQSENQKPNGLVLSDSAGTKSSRIKYSFPQRYDESYKNSMDHFLDALSGKPVEISRDEVVNACKVVSACEQSYHTGLPVTMEW